MTLVEHIFRNNIILYFRNKLYTNENASKETEIISLNIGDYIDVLVEKIEEHFGEVTEMALF
jgi:hypothetical protein